MLPIFSSCSGQKSIRCEEPFIRLGDGCCLDTNRDNACDHGDEIYHEKQTFEVAEPVPESLEAASARKQMERESAKYWDFVTRKQGK